MPFVLVNCAALVLAFIASAGPALALSAPPPPQVPTSSPQPSRAPQPAGVINITKAATSSISIVKSVNAVDPLHPTAFEDASTAPGPILLAGSTVTWTYLVTNTGTTTLDVVGVLDNGGGCADCGFPVLPVVGANGFIVGDTNHNEKLDPGETWLFEATGTVPLGQYTNTATVLANIVNEPSAPGTCATNNAVQLCASTSANLYGTEPGIAVVKELNGQVARDPNSPVIVAAGSAETYTYDVTTTTNAPLTDITVTDNAGIPGNTSGPSLANGEITPDVVSSCGGVAGTFNFGDTNCNGILDPGETWKYTYRTTATVGAFANVVRVSGVLVGVSPATTVWANDINYSFGDQPAISVTKAIDALNPFDPTTIENANTQPAKELLVGTTAVWTYVVTNTGNAPVKVTSIIDNNGTPAYTADDFTPQPVLGPSGYNVGDTNHNGLLDPGETWLYEATTTVQAGAYENTVSVVVTQPFTKQTATGTDVAGYYGETIASGLTLGYWKNHVSAWPANADGTLIFSPAQLVSSVFGPVPGSDTSETLLEALDNGGGGTDALLRQAVAALLNTTSQYIAYPDAAAVLIATVDAALQSDNATQIDDLQIQLNTWNNAGATLPAGHHQRQ